MKRVILECKGRLANQILSWANAVHVLDRLGIEDRLIVIVYPDLIEAIFPAGTLVKFKEDVSALPRVTRNDLALFQSGDCLWVWEDVYSNFPDDGRMKRIIKTIRFPRAWERPFLNKSVGIHVRYGDYVQVDADNPPVPPPPFPRATKQYYLDAVAACRELDPLAAFFVASDGSPEELEFLTSQQRVDVGDEDEPLKDLFSLAQCRLIIGSESTYSRVAACYGDVPITLPSMSAADIRKTIEGAI